MTTLLLINLIIQLILTATGAVLLVVTCLIVKCYL